MSKAQLVTIGPVAHHRPKKTSAVPAANEISAATTWLMRTRPHTTTGRSRSGSRKKRPRPYHAKTANA